MSEWNEPKSVDDLTATFPGNVIGTLLPKWDDIPDKFKQRRNSWCKLVSRLFFEGGHLPPVRAGLDATAAARHLQAVLKSFEPQHEHKEAGAAWLMSLWYEKGKGHD